MTEAGGTVEYLYTVSGWRSPLGLVWQEARSPSVSRAPKSLRRRLGLKAGDIIARKVKDVFDRDVKSRSSPLAWSSSWARSYRVVSLPGRHAGTGGARSPIEGLAIQSNDLLRLDSPN